MRAGLPRRDDHARLDVRGAGAVGTSAQEEYAGARLGQAAGAGEDAAQVEESVDGEGRGRVEDQRAVDRGGGAGRDAHRRRTAGQGERGIRDARQAGGAEVEAADGDGFGQADDAAGAEEVRDVEIGVVPSDHRGAVEPARRGGIPRGGAA